MFFLFSAIKIVYLMNVVCAVFVVLFVIVITLVDKDKFVKIVFAKSVVEVIPFVQVIKLASISSVPVSFSNQI